MNSAPIAWSSLLILLIGGCQQHSNSAVPLSPISPLGANTRVPPPQTGSYAVPNGYYQGQASVAPATSGQYAGPYAGGVTAASDLVANETPTLNGWSDASGGVSPSAIQPAAYQDGLPYQSGPAYQNDAYQNDAYQNDANSTVASRGGGAAFGPSSAPRIPASALQGSAAGATPLRPNLRGMEVVDMTAPEPLQPTDPPTLQAIDHGQMRTAANFSSGSAAPTFRSLSPAETAASEMNSSVTATAAVTSGGARDVPSTSKGSTADLPWRKPTR